MKNIKYVAIALIVLLIIIIGVLITINLMQKNENTGDKTNEISENSISNTINTSTQDEPNDNVFFTVENCVQTYYKYIYSQYEGTNFDTMVEGISNEEEKKNAILSVLDTTYISENNINTDNVLNLGEGINHYVKFAGTDYKVVSGQRIDTYAIVGKLYENMKEISSNGFIVRLDKENLAFSIEPVQVDNIDEIQITTNEIPIEANNFNTFTYENLSEDELVTKYFADYKRQVIGNANAAFEMLDDEYREKKFADVTEFGTYISDRNIQTAFLESYQINNYDEYTQYVCLDQYNNYYIFNVNDVMSYDVLLDIYTVDLPEFIERYNRANNGERAGLNLQRAFDAINNKDYEYVYNKLDDTFKENNFPTLNEFEEYITENFYNSNNVTYSNYKSSGGLHMYDATILDAENEESSPITKTFIIKLLDGTDFTMSFNV